MQPLECNIESRSHLDELNSAQREAATYGINPNERARPTPPLLVIAGAGSGKTKTLVHRVAHLMLHGANPRRILLLTFARRMAAEMTRRVSQVCAALDRRERNTADAFIWSGTFHSIGARLLRLHANAVGLDPAFSVIDRGDAEDLLDLSRDELQLSAARKRFPKKVTCLAIYSYVVNAQSSVHEALVRNFPWCAEWEDELSRLFRAYVDAKQAQSVLDYDDLLLYWSLMMGVPEVATEVSQRFDHILVDEYQDTNVLQSAILLGLRPRGDGLTVVGDDAQSIYSFRSATVRNILDFPNQFTPPAAIVKLEQNYRSTPSILTACNRIIARATEGIPKLLRSVRADGGKPILATATDESEQVDFVVERILRLREQGIELRQQAVLVRTSHHSSQLEVELTRRNIPFVKFGGLKFLEAAHIKDVVAVLRWAENPRDRMAGIRVIKLLPGIGAATAHKAFATLPGNTSDFSALKDVRVPDKAKDAWNALVVLLNELASSRAWQADMERVRSWYDPLLQDRYESPRTRLSDLDQLQRIAATHPTRSSFLTDIVLDPTDAVSGEAGPPLKDEDWLTISTIHSAKGHEWRAVFLLNVVDGCIPSDLATGTSQEIEEERRLLYVAMTRAKDELVLIQPQRFYTRSLGFDNHVYAARSRFIADDDLACFELCQGAHPKPAAETSDGPIRVDLRSKVKGMWA